MKFYPIITKIYTIVFCDDSGKAIKTINVKENDIINDIPTFEKDGFRLIGWSLNHKNVFDFTEVISSDLKLYPLLEEVIIAKKRGCTKCNSAMSFICISVATTFALILLKKRK